MIYQVIMNQVLTIPKLYTIITIMQWTSKCLLNRESVNLHSGTCFLLGVNPYISLNSEANQAHVYALLETV